ncbi:hypothetical protein [Oceanobacillus caeni]|uniref:hypothetical protein n=1 Tax=Oceanobacillus caeni TaxID=405946 RepID=UPI002E215A30|nr:hypothetical protein [Oceanobacillus caeni]
MIIAQTIGNKGIVKSFLRHFGTVYLTEAGVNPLRQINNYGATGALNASTLTLPQMLTYPPPRRVFSSSKIQ